MNNFLFFDYASFSIIGAMIFAVFFRKTYKGLTNLIFLGCLVCSLLAVTCRIFSLFFEMYFPPSEKIRTLMYVFLYAFFFFLNFVVPIMYIYMYSAIDILQLYKRNYFIRILMEILTFFPVVYLITNIISHRLFVIDENLHCVYSSRAMVLPAFTLCILILSMIIIMYYIPIISKEGFKIAISICWVNIIFSLINFKLKNLELQMFMIAITAFFISSTTQRPEAEIDSRLNCASYFYFKNKTRKNFLLKKNDYYILIKITNYQNINLYIGHNNYENFLRILADWFSTLCKKKQLHTTPYYLENSLFVIHVDELYKSRIQAVSTELENILKESFSIDNYEFFIDPRICVVESQTDITDYDYLLYFAKNFHHILPKTKKVIFLKEFKESADFKIKNEIDNILKNALTKDSFEIFYHPIYGVRESRYVAAEALLRLKDEYFGYISPNAFIPFAERNGQISEIGYIVFEKVMQFVASEDFKNLNLDYIEINISASQCIESDLVDIISELLNKYDVSPKHIRFEITESFADFNPQVVEKNITSLHNMGILFALDDYGIGYSNIKKVLSLPIEVVKLDKTFVDELENQKLKILVNDTIEMLNNLNKKVLVEGIEDKTTFDYFNELKHKNLPACEYIQGYYFSTPLPQSDFVEFIRKA